MSTPSRRTALSMLGLAPATMIGTEDFSRDVSATKRGIRFGVEYPNTMSAALRSLADDIDAGMTYVIGTELRSSSHCDEFLEHYV